MAKNFFYNGFSGKEDTGQGGNNMEEKVKNPTKNPFAALGKWFYVLAAMALLLVASIVVIIVLAVGGKETPDPIDDVISEGTETGIYYYDTVLGEYTLSLNSGNRFTIAGPDLNKSGEYTVADGTVTLDFVRDEDGTATATLSADGISLNYDSKTMNFL